MFAATIVTPEPRHVFGQITVVGTLGSTITNEWQLQVQGVQDLISSFQRFAMTFHDQPNRLGLYLVNGSDTLSSFITDTTYPPI